MMTTYARDLRPGDVIDLLPALKTYTAKLEEAMSYEHDAAAFEFAVVEGVDHAEPVSGEGAVIVYTDQHNVKLPALYPFEIERGNAR
ncbi:hypothetical protein ACI7YT_12520 [Microbacterium sp. M]|uniref:hypothetical protein n=1 Tax=Microbacterium sp. M TaxID=3377125 RepID=UPI00386718E2